MVAHRDSRAWYGVRGVMVAAMLAVGSSTVLRGDLGSRDLGTAHSIAAIAAAPSNANAVSAAEQSSSDQSGLTSDESTHLSSHDGPAETPVISPAPRDPLEGAPPAHARVTLYGRAGSFGSLATRTNDTSVATAPIASWSWLPGQAAYFTTVDARGRLLIANEPQTDNQTQPTASTMVVSVFDPARGTFDNVVVPTSMGADAANAADGSGIGGADVGGLQLIDGPSGQRLAIVSTSPYNGWDPEAIGVYPALAVLDQTGGVWGPPAQSYTAAELRRSSSAGGSACGRELLTIRADVADCGGFSEIGVFPQSLHLVATRYFGDPSRRQSNGGLAVLTPEGVVVASFDYPPVSVGGRSLRVRPREVDVDPTSTIGDERFLVVFDVDQGPFLAQEFRYDAARAVIEAVSAPFVTGAVLDNVTAGVETAAYDHAGNLWIAEAESSTLIGGRIVRYGPGEGRGRLAHACGVGYGGVADRWGLACTPDQVEDATLRHGLVRSLTEDIARHRMMAVTTDGAVVVVSVRGSVLAIRLPLDLLIDRNRFWIGPRKGGIDPAGAALWVPIQQLRNPAVCPSGSCLPATLDQWVARIDCTDLAPGI